MKKTTLTVLSIGISLLSAFSSFAGWNKQISKVEVLKMIPLGNTTLLVGNGLIVTETDCQKVTTLILVSVTDKHNYARWVCCQ